MEENKEELTEVSKEEEVKKDDSNIKNLEKLLEEREKQIEQLLKQQKITKQVNEQLNETLNEKFKESMEANKDPYEWVEDAINKSFEYKAKFNINDTQDFLKGTPQIASWYFRYLKEEEKNSNAQIAGRYERMIKEVNSGVQAHEEL